MKKFYEQQYKKRLEQDMRFFFVSSFPPKFQATTMHGNEHSEDNINLRYLPSVKDRLEQAGSDGLDGNALSDIS